MESFFPKCFNISKSQGGSQAGPFSNDIEVFVEEYRFVYSMSILKKFIEKYRK